jgi:hypothetical protein
MNASFRVGARGALSIAFCVSMLGTVARAQDAPPPPAGHVQRCPVCGGVMPAERCSTCQRPFNDPVDRHLDETLRREYGDPNGPPAPQPPEDTRFAPPPIHVVNNHHEDDDDFGKFRLGFLAAGAGSYVRDARVGSAGTHADRGWGAQLRFGAWIDLGRYFSIEGAYAVTGFEKGRRDDRRNPYAFSGWGYGTVPEPRRDYAFETADVNLVVHPFACDLGQLDLLVGGRYLSGELTTRLPYSYYNFGYGIGPGPKVRSRLEGGMPMVGIGGVLRPVKTNGFTLELYARSRVGGFSYRDDGYYGDHADRGYYGGGYRANGRWHVRPADKYMAATIEAEGGVRFIFADTVGVALGARYEYNEIHKSDLTSDNRADWRSVSPFVALFVQL